MSDTSDKMTFQAEVMKLRYERLNQPKVTLQQAQKQAVRVMEAARHSPHRLKQFSVGAKPMH